MESGISTASLTDLVGSTQYIKALNTIASEVYPTAFTQATTITVGGVGGTRTITYHL
jgi:type IV pilus assembly protein PilA